MHCAVPKNTPPEKALTHQMHVTVTVTVIVTVTATVTVMLCIVTWCRALYSKFIGENQLAKGKWYSVYVTCLMVCGIWYMVSCAWCTSYGK